MLMTGVESYVLLSGLIAGPCDEVWMKIEIR